MAGGDLKHRLVAQNRRARHDYVIEDSVEAGLVLLGPEVKSLRTGKASLNEAFAQVQEGELFLVNAHIAPYGPANRFSHEPKRPRKLLLHRRQIGRLAGLVQREGYTLVPLRLYFNDRGRAKVEIGVAKGRKLHDKRARERDKSWQRDKARILRERG